jgi:natural product precursor
MKNKLLKLADSLLSKEEMKSLKGGDYPPGNPPAGGGSHYAYCYDSYSGRSAYIPVFSCNYYDLQAAFNACGSMGLGVVSCS